MKSTALAMPGSMADADLANAGLENTVRAAPNDGEMRLFMIGPNDGSTTFRAEKDIQMRLFVHNLPKHVKRVRLPRHTLMLPKNFERAVPEDRPVSDDTFEVFVQVVCASSVWTSTAAKEGNEEGTTTITTTTTTTSAETQPTTSTTTSPLDKHTQGDFEVDVDAVSRLMQRAEQAGHPPIYDTTPEPATHGSRPTTPVKERNPDSWSKIGGYDPLRGDPVRPCTICVAREKKRAERGCGQITNKQAAFDRWMADSPRRILGFSSEQVLEWSEHPLNMHCLDLKMRILCYCRHVTEKRGYHVILTLRDSAGNCTSGMSGLIKIDDKSEAGRSRSRRRESVPEASVDDAPQYGGDSNPAPFTFSMDNEAPAMVPDHMVRQNDAVLQGVMNSRPVNHQSANSVVSHKRRMSTDSDTSLFSTATGRSVKSRRVSRPQSIGSAHELSLDLSAATFGPARGRESAPSSAVSAFAPQANNAPFPFWGRGNYDVFGGGDGSANPVTQGNVLSNPVSPAGVLSSNVTPGNVFSGNVTPANIALSNPVTPGEFMVDAAPFGSDWANADFAMGIDPLAVGMDAMETNGLFDSAFYNPFLSRSPGGQSAMSGINTGVNTNVNSGVVNTGTSNTGAVDTSMVNSTMVNTGTINTPVDLLNIANDTSHTRVSGEFGALDLGDTLSTESIMPYPPPAMHHQAAAQVDDGLDATLLDGMLDNSATDLASFNVPHALFANERWGQQGRVAVPAWTQQISGGLSSSAPSRMMPSAFGMPNHQPQQVQPQQIQQQHSPQHHHTHSPQLQRLSPQLQRLSPQLQRLSPQLQRLSPPQRLSPQQHHLLPQRPSPRQHQTLPANLPHRSPQMASAATIRPSQLQMTRSPTQAVLAFPPQAHQAQHHFGGQQQQQQQQQGGRSGKVPSHLKMTPLT